MAAKAITTRIDGACASRALRTTTPPLTTTATEDMLRRALDIVKIDIDIVMAPLRLLVSTLEVTFDRIHRITGAFQKGGFLSAVGEFFNVKSDLADFGKRLGQNFKGVGTRLTTNAKDYMDAVDHPETAAQMHAEYHRRQQVATVNREPVKTLSEQPVKAKIDGPVNADLKGRLAIDLHIDAPQGLTVTKTGVDGSGAPYVGDVGVSGVTP